MRILAVVELSAEGSPRLISDSPGVAVAEAYRVAYLASQGAKGDWEYLQYLLQEIPMEEVAK